MDLKGLFTDDEAVSPVIGVILMVAITVILAAVIGAFVLGIGSSQEKAPQASIAFDYEPVSSDGFGDGGSTSSDGDEITIKHDGGETFDATKLSLSIGSGTGEDTVSDLTSSGSSTLVSSTSWSDATSAGSSVTVKEGSAGGSAKFEPGDSVTITWTASSGDSTQILAESQVPS